MSRVVVHVTLALGRYSESWLYDLVTAPVTYEARVLTHIRENEGEFPFERVGMVRVSERRGSRTWFQHHLHQRLGWPGPANSWRPSLRRLRGGASLFHAHYGWIGWRTVEAGLSPTVTSFYGVDASETRTLEMWREAYARLFRQGAAFVAEGPAMRQRLIALGAPPERTHVLPLIAHLDASWQPASLAGGETPRVLMPGRFVEKKGFADGIAAFGEVRRAGIDARLLIMGSGPEEEQLRRAVRAQAIENTVEFVPTQPRGRFREIVRACHVLLQPSRTAATGDAEGGAPVTLLEAQGLGRVIVATEHADIPHVVDPHAAFLSPEGDQDALSANLIRALAASDEWEERGAAGRRFVEQHHSRERVATLLERLYDGVLADA